jgi:hypothetical protein
MLRVSGYLITELLSLVKGQKKTNPMLCNGRKFSRQNAIIRGSNNIKLSSSRVK